MSRSPEQLLDRNVDVAIAELAQVESTAGLQFEDDSGDIRQRSYPELGRAAERVAAAFQEMGARPGDRALLVLPDNAAFITTFLGAIRAGLIPAPLSPPLGFGGMERYLEGVRHVVERCDAAWIVSDASCGRRLLPLTHRRPGLRVLQPAALQSDAVFTPIARTMDDVCFLQFTSGSTGRHRGVIVRHGNAVANLRAIAHAFREFGLEPGRDPAVSWLPLFHDMGLIGSVLLPLFLHNPVHLLTPLTFLKRPARWLQAISQHRAVVSFSPNFGYALCARRLRPVDLESLDLSCWKVAGCGSEPIQPRDLRAFARRLAPVGFNARALTCAYGLAEATVGVSLHRSGEGLTLDRVDPEALRREGQARPAGPGPSALEIPSCGRPLLDTEVQVFAPDDLTSAHPLAERLVGELRLRGPSITSGYWGEAPHDSTAHAGSWLRTGDQGYLAGGEVYITGRLKDVLIVHGRNYAPQDIEWAAAEIDGVFNRVAMAFSVPSAEGERAVVAIEVIATAHAVQRRIARAVKRRIFERLGLRVAEVLAVARGTLPRTTSGKHQRFRARDLYVSGALAPQSALQAAPRR